jgi:hypothetical protein
MLVWWDECVACEWPYHPESQPIFLLYFGAIVLFDQVEGATERKEVTGADGVGERVLSVGQEVTWTNTRWQVVNNA